MEGFVKVIVVTLNNQRYGADIHQVLSIEKMREITKVPGTSDFIKGIINLRGETIPIIDLKERLHIDRTEATNDSRILIVNVGTVTVGLIVDSATDVMDIDMESVEPAIEMVGIVDEIYIKGIAKIFNELLVLLDLEKVLDFDEKEEVKKIEAEQGEL